MRHWMSAKCPECGAPLPEGGSCRDNFDALLALEWEIPGGPGEIAHFYAVGSYVLQHPEELHGGSAVRPAAANGGSSARAD